MSGQRLIITCGGTGGHFYPGLALARRHMACGHPVLMLLSGVNSESQRSIAQSFGIPVEVLPLMPSPGHNPVRACCFLNGLIRGYRQTRLEITRFRPDAVLGMGSFASLPVVLAAHASGIPIFLHDGNARIGRANRFLSRFARFLGTAFPPVNADRVRCRCNCVGMPLRPELVAAEHLERAEAIARLNHRYGCRLTPEIPVLLVFSGSQGAAAINAVIPEALRKLAPGSLQVIHLTGTNTFDEVQSSYQGIDTPLLLLPSCDAMELPYSAADLVISRSGGSTVAELQLFGKGAVLIPYPYAAEQHQWDNARVMVQGDAALALANNDCDAPRIARILQDFLDHPALWQNRGKQAFSLAHPDASDRMLAEIFAVR
ncbi:MAG: UDP-N-acetylglucosamine--N-acetylmuramyl-(pentapeptide) pyrophosphoryl-undecaprenol N-acetylglucosamine transferase [Lentisphaeria bacterium]|nr:UDP-N-acetylglucosamine--N-acetylmuramyl-(pentapeptide) pyrophosphoryl-undecaprenol N-acetylglucosamine transferase [Lentisphaeria bacterium]